MPARRNAATSVDYKKAGELLSTVFEEAEKDYAESKAPAIDAPLKKALDTIFASNSQSYREVLVGCALARHQDLSVDVTKPYSSMGEGAFNGRSLDEGVVNPFFQTHRVPCSKGPYLAVFRRQTKFTEATAKGLRDQDGFKALLVVIRALASAPNQTTLKTLLFDLLYYFVDLRNRNRVELTKVHRLSIEQHASLNSSLLSTKSGGLFPVFLAVAMFQTIKECFGLDWEIEWQGINVADRASGAGGDITLKRKGKVIMAVEVTERPIDRSRVVSTFNTKISLNNIDDYIFFHSASAPDESARTAARQYFAQGHDISFLDVSVWLENCLGTIGPKCRSLFTANFLKLLDDDQIPGTLKMAWNNQVEKIIGA